MWPNTAKNSFGTARPAKRVFLVDTSNPPAPAAVLIFTAGISLFLVITIAVIMVGRRLAAISSGVDVA
jgi:hypothetical protein